MGGIIVVLKASCVLTYESVTVQRIIFQYPSKNDVSTVRLIEDEVRQVRYNASPLKRPNHDTTAYTQ